MTQQSASGSASGTLRHWPKAKKKVEDHMLPFPACGVVPVTARYCRPYKPPPGHSLT